MAKTYTPAAFCSINRKSAVNKNCSPDGGVRNFYSLSPICQKRRYILFRPARAAPRAALLRKNAVLRKFVHIRNSAKNQTERPVYPWFLCKKLVKVIVSKAVHAKSRSSRASPAGGCVSPRDSPSTSRATPPMHGGGRPCGNRRRAPRRSGGRQDLPSSGRQFHDPAVTARPPAKTGVEVTLCKT